MTECTCPEDDRSIPKDDRIYVYEPTAEVRMGNHILRDASKVHLFHKNCPKHGYKDITDDKNDD